MLLAFAALLLGALWTVSSLQPRPPSETSADVGFARDMSDHHAQAVAMAEMIRDETADPEIRTLATDIALTQQAQIGQMRGWLEAWGRPVAGRGDPMAWMGHGGSEMPGMATPRQLDALDQAIGSDADELFLRLMIRHHRGGLLMASAGIAQADQDEVQILARAIRDGQTAEINAMDELLVRLSAAPETAAVTMSTATEPDDPANDPNVWRYTPLALVVGPVVWLLVDHRARRSTGVPVRRRGSRPSEDRAHWSQFVLVVTGVILLALAAPALLDARGGLGSTHTWRELGATEIALGAGLLFCAVQPSRAIGLLPVATALVVTNIGVGIVDLAGDRAAVTAELKHVVEIVALGALALLAHRERMDSSSTAPSVRPSLVEH